MGVRVFVYGESVIQKECVGMFMCIIQNIVFVYVHVGCGVRVCTVELLS